MVISILTVHYQNTPMLCILDVHGDKVGTDVGSRLAKAQEEQFGKYKIHPFLHRCAFGALFVFERELLSWIIIAG